MTYGVLALLVVGLVIAMRHDLMRERREVSEMLRTMDTFSRWEARGELRRQRKAQRRIEERGYL